MAVKGRKREEILAAFEQRPNNDAASEFRAALDEVDKIALFRLQELRASGVGLILLPRRKIVPMAPSRMTTPAAIGFHKAAAPMRSALKNPAQQDAYL